MSPTARLPLLAAVLSFAGLAGCERKPVVETQPVPLTKPRFHYPDELWDAGVEGKTVLAIRIDTAGRVDSARVETPARHPAFDSAALAGTDSLRFEPARRDGTPVPRWVLLPVEFNTAAGSAARADTTAQRTRTQ